MMPPNRTGFAPQGASGDARDTPNTQSHAFRGTCPARAPARASAATQLQFWVRAATQFQFWVRAAAQFRFWVEALSQFRNWGGLGGGAPHAPAGAEGYAPPKCSGDSMP